MNIRLKWNLRFGVPGILFGLGLGFTLPLWLAMATTLLIGLILGDVIGHLTRKERSERRPDR